MSLSLEPALLVILLGTFYGNPVHGNMKTLMEQHQIVPDLLAVAPELTLQVSYENDVNVENGEELQPTKVKSQPSVSWNAEDGALYTLMMVSPDAPSRGDPTLKEFQNWLVINIPGNDIAKGDVLTEYVGAGPPVNTGMHRYIFLLFKQATKINADEKIITRTSGNPRLHFSTQNFAQKYTLGNPVAGNFFQAQFDDYVTELHKQTGLTLDDKN